MPSAGVVISALQWLRINWKFEQVHLTTWWGSQNIATEWQTQCIPDQTVLLGKDCSGTTIKSAASLSKYLG